MGAIFHQQYFETNARLNKDTLELPPPFAAELAALAPNGGVRVSEPLPSGRDYLRYFAYALKNFDTTMLTIGGYVLGTQGAEPELRQFARAFSALPAVQFKTVSDEDNVLLRAAAAEGKAWFYAVNLSAKQRTVTIRLNAPEACDAATGLALQQTAEGQVTLTLRPYELLAVRAPL